jgi:DNA mismatch repair protein PMS2
MSVDSGVIRRIDRDSVHRICANQVIFDLSIAVKELLENALDAGSSRVEIKLRNHGYYCAVE